MSTVYGRSTRALAAILGAVIGLGAVAPVSAGPVPVSAPQTLDSAQLVAETVQYRAPRRAAPRVRRRGNDGAAAAAILGAVAIGAAALIAKNADDRRRRRLEREYYYGGGDPYGYGYGQPGPRYAPVQRYYAPVPQPRYGGEYYPQPAPQARWQRQPPRIDGGSPYAVQQQRIQQRQYGAPGYRQPQPQQQYYTEPYNGPF